MRERERERGRGGGRGRGRARARARARGRDNIPLVGGNVVTGVNIDTMVVLSVLCGLDCAGVVGVCVLVVRFTVVVV